MRVHYWQHKERTRTKSNKRGKVKYYPKEKSKGNPSVSTKKRDTWRKITSNFKHGLRKKGNQISFVCYESNMVDVNHNTVNWFWFYNSYFKYLAGYAKPKEVSGKWAVHLFKKQDAFTCGGYWDMHFSFK